MDNAKLTAAIVFLGNHRLMLDPVVFAPPAQWAAVSLAAQGVERFLVVCRQEDREEAAACFPGNAGFILPSDPKAGEKLHTFLENTQGRVAVLTKPVLFFRQGAAHMAQAHALPKGKSAAGALRMDARALLDALEAAGDLTGALAGDWESLDSCVTPLAGDFVARASAQETGRRLTAAWWMERGVAMLNYDATYISPTVEIEGGTTLLPGTILKGKTRIAKGCTIGPNTLLEDATVGEGTTVNASQATDCSIGAFTTVGPFAYIRPHTQVGDHVKVGDFVELKNSAIGDGTKISHLTYVGDSDVGRHINFGCGTVTVNYDGKKKFRTKIGDGAFIGCNTNLVAPVRVGAGSYIAAGSTITDDVPDDSLAIARSQQVVKNQWAKKRRAKQENP